jgi:hypothetical protein
MQRQAATALVRGDAAAVASARAIHDELDKAGRALDIELDVELLPLAQEGGESTLTFHRRVRSGDTAFFGRRDARGYVAGFEVEVAAHSGSAEPLLGRALSGRGLHVLACRVAGGERVFLWGCLDLADLAEVADFDPGTADLGILQQPRIDSLQVVFAGVVDAAGKLEVEVRGARLSTRDWKLTLRARTTSDAQLDAAAGTNGGGAGAGSAGFAVVDMALLSTELPELEACEPGTLLSARLRSRPIEVATAPLPPSAVAALVEAARGTGGRGVRSALYWSERVLLVPRSDPKALAEARAFVRAAESARIATGRIEVELEGAKASLPTCALVPARFVTGSERPLLVEYRLEVAPETWMPAPVVETAFDGVCFEITPEARGAAAAVWMSRSGPVVELAREGAQVGRLQLAARSLHTGALRVESGAPGTLALAGTAEAVATARFEAR